MRLGEYSGAARRLARAPAFSVTVVALLAIGLAAMLTLMSAASVLLLQPLPYPEGDRLVEVRGHSRSMGFSLGFAPALLDTLAAMAEVERVVAWDHSRPLEGEHGELLHSARLGDGLLELLGARALHGRLLRIEDVGSDAALLSESAWRSRFGADPGIVGQRLRIGATTLHVVGVVAEGFRFPQRETALWRPLDVAALKSGKGFDWGAVQALARLAPGASVPALRHAIDARIAPLPELAQMREFMQLELQAESLRERWARTQRGALGLGLGAVALVLAMVGANLAGLWMQRGLRRQRELAIRGALGATAGRIAGAMTAEIVLLSVVALAIALALVPVGTQLLAWLGLLDGATPWLAMGTASLDARVLAAGGVLAALLAAAMSVPSLVIARRVGAADLGGAARALSLGVRGERTRRLLVAGQVCLAVTLLAGGALLARSMLSLLEQDPGFVPDGLVMVRVEPAGDDRIDPAGLRVLYEAAAALPGVAASTFSNAAPFSGSEAVSSFIDPARPEVPLSGRTRVVGNDWFAVMRQPILRGRPLTPGDVGAAVVVVDQRFAEQMFGATDPVGARIGLTGGPGERTVSAEIVGVAGTVRHARLGEQVEQGTVYRTADTPDARHTSLLLRTSQDSVALAPALRSLAAAQGLRIADVRSASAAVRDSVSDRRPLLVVALGFALIGVALAGVGLFAQVAFAVERRRAEFGLRLAIGATPAMLGRLTLADAARIAVPGLGLGLAGGLLVGRLLSSHLHGVSPHDPLSMLAVLGSVGACLVLAAFVPAWRASRVDPNQCLRCD